MRALRSFIGICFVLGVALVTCRAYAQGSTPQVEQLAPSRGAHPGYDSSSRPQRLLAAAAPALYTIVNVAPDDVLNIRREPGAASPVVGKMPPYAMGIQIRQVSEQSKSTTWVPIRYENLTGWVNRGYLARQVGSLDKAPAAQATEIIWALKTKDIAALSRLAHPDKGVRFSPYAYIRPQDLVFSAAAIRQFPSDQSSYSWGDFDGSGELIRMTFDDYFKRFIYDVDFASPHQVGYRAVIGRGNTINNIAQFYPNAIFIEYHFNGLDPNYTGMDWRSLRLVLEKHRDTWRLVGIVHDEWTT